MRKLLGILGVLALLRGAACLVTGFTVLDVGPVRPPGFLDGLEICAGITLLVPGFAPFAVAESRKSG
ncbi:hypothetical protein [Streptomyces sp. NPDC058625]|uniref:hypothetical protein n=1 Tax=Streptomyces sp. NPDC058625 TaxID=3346564 RepID=UPI00364CA035